MPDRAVISVHTSKETAERLGKIAARSSRSRSALAKEAIERFIEDEEAWQAKIAKSIEQADDCLGITTEELLRRARERYLGSGQTAAE